MPASNPKAKAKAKAVSLESEGHRYYAGCTESATDPRIELSGTSPAAPYHQNSVMHRGFGGFHGLIAVRRMVDQSARVTDR